MIGQSAQASVLQVDTGYLLENDGYLSSCLVQQKICHLCITTIISLDSFPPSPFCEISVRI